jgi:hypothetical protein
MPFEIRELAAAFLQLCQIHRIDASFLDGLALVPPGHVEVVCGATTIRRQQLPTASVTANHELRSGV